MLARASDDPARSANGLGRDQTIKTATRPQIQDTFAGLRPGPLVGLRSSPDPLQAEGHQIFRSIAQGFRDGPGFFECLISSVDSRS